MLTPQPFISPLSIIINIFLVILNLLSDILTFIKFINYFKFWLNKNLTFWSYQCCFSLVFRFLIGWQNLILKNVGLRNFRFYFFILNNFFKNHFQVLGYVFGLFVFKKLFRKIVY